MSNRLLGMYEKLDKRSYSVSQAGEILRWRNDGSTFGTAGIRCGGRLHHQELYLGL